MQHFPHISSLINCSHFITTFLARGNGNRENILTLTDAEIIRRVRKGKLDDYGILIDRYQQRLLASAHHMLGNLEEARDAVQETFIEGYRHLEQLRDDDRLLAWLYTILRRKAQIQYAKRRDSISWEENEVDKWLLQPAIKEQIDLPELLSCLPESDREALAARYLLDMSYEELAHSLGVSAQNARVRVCRAKERLRKLLAEVDGKLKTEEVGI